MIGNQRTVLSARFPWAARVTALLSMIAAGCVSGSVTAQPPPSPDSGRGRPATVAPKAPDEPWLGEFGPVDARIPAPRSVAGRVVGDGAIRYDEMVRYFTVLAEASPRVRLTPYGVTYEGRALHFLTITSEANHAKLDAIRRDNAKLADPRRLSGPEEAQRILDTLPGVAWMAYAIHGDELSSTDAAVQIAYQLAAGTGDDVGRLLDGLVIHIDPLMNPDGRERYLSQLQYLMGKVPNPDYQAMQHRGLWAAGRGNHYLFDMNRDWLMQIHPETQGRAARILEWNPHLVVDSHEMGALDTYLFDPPREPHNVELSESNMRWRRLFSTDQARAFDRHGWSYYTQEWYEEWYPGYANAWTSLLGSVGLLYEQAGVNAASVKRPAGDTLTYAEAVHHQIVSSMANLRTLQEHRREILADFLADRQWAVSAERSGSDVFLVPPCADRPLQTKLVDLLRRQGIEVATAAAAFEARDVVDLWGRRSDSKELPIGTIVVRAAQPHRRLLRAILSFDPHLTDTFLQEERKEIENRRGTRVYDITAWNLPMAYGLQAYWAGSVPEISVAEVPASAAPRPSRSPAYGYLIDGASSDVSRAIVRLVDRGCQIRVATKPFAVGGHAYEPGALLVRRHENPEGLPSLIDEVTTELDLIVRPAETALCETGPDLGGNRFHLLVPPRIAIASQWPISASSFGEVWYLLDYRLGLRVSPVSLQGIGWIDLRKYNVIVLPDSWNANLLAGVLDEGTRARLRTWIEAGGTLIALGESAAFLADKDRGLSAVRLRHDVLDQLAVYEEALARERGARCVRVEPGAVWGPQAPGTPEAGGEVPAPEDGGAASDKVKGKDQAGEKPKDKGKDLEALKREDGWQRLFSPNGVMLSATLDPEHWLCFGLGAGGLENGKLPVMYTGGNAFLSKHPIRTPVRLDNKAELRLAGLVWPEARDRLADTAYATVERVGYGQIILFAGEPFFRGYLEGTGRLLTNALLMGPGLGTSPPVPW